MNPNPYEQQPQQQPPQPIVIQQNTSPGTKIAVWIIAAILGIPLIITFLCCVGGPLLTMIAGAFNAGANP